MYIVKQEQKDKKSNFSPFELEIKPGADISYPDIKKAGNLQTTVALDYESSIVIESNKDKKSKKKTGSTQLHQQDERANIATSTFIKTNKCKKHKKKK